MAFIPNVVDGNIILAAWGNPIRDVTRQVFASKAELDAQWPAAPNGAHAVTLDTGYVWERRAGAWGARMLAGKANYGTNASGDCIVAFPVTMAGTPNVMVCNAYEGAAYVSVTLHAAIPPSPTGFAFRAWSTQNAGAALGNATIAVSWMALA
jgi:hypothetical protein